MFCLTKKLPVHIKQNFIYSWVYRLIYREEQNCVLLFIGNVGLGKSTGALRWGEDLDPSFSVERVCFNLEQFFTLLDRGDSKGKLRRGSVLVFDEAAGSKEAVDSRESLTATNKIVSFFSTISRAKGYIIIYCIPLISQLDKRARSIGVKGICNFLGVDRREKRGRAVFYYNITHSFSDKAMRPKPRVRGEDGERLLDHGEISIPLPRSKELVKAYKRKKNMFIDESVSKWKKEIDGINKSKKSFAEYCKEAKRREKELMDKDGVVNVGKIRLVLGVGDNAAHSIRSVVFG